MIYVDYEDNRVKGIFMFKKFPTLRDFGAWVCENWDHIVIVELTTA